VDEISKQTQIIRVALMGDQEHETNPETCQQLTQEILSTDLLSKLVQELGSFEFESKKDVVSIVCNIVRKEYQSRCLGADYVVQHSEYLLELLMNGYENSEIALQYGAILRECIKHEQIAKLLLYSQHFYRFFTFVEVANFDVASDAFLSFKDLLSLHKPMSAEFLEANFDIVFENYTVLLNSQNYATRRLSLKLLGELLLDRSHFNIMTKYISDVNNLKLMMMLLRDKSKSIQFESFHVFKVFVANPNKPQGILDILVKNKERLISFLTNFQKDKDDDQFKDEKAFLLKQIQQL